jgi:hypothetical protein
MEIATVPAGVPPTDNELRRGRPVSSAMFETRPGSGFTGLYLVNEIEQAFIGHFFVRGPTGRHTAVRNGWGFDIPAMGLV